MSPMSLATSALLLLGCDGAGVSWNGVVLEAVFLGSGGKDTLSRGVAVGALLLSCLVVQAFGGTGCLAEGFAWGGWASRGSRLFLGFSRHPLKLAGCSPAQLAHLAGRVFGLTQRWVEWPSPHLRQR